MFRIVEFQSEGATLRGRLYAHGTASQTTPMVIMAHGFSATLNGMVADRYAEAFFQGGFGVLLYDHRNFGISGGEPRQEINKWVQARGYRDAVDFAATLPGIDPARIALWGDSMSGAEVIAVAALDRRVKAVIAQVPACGDEHPPPDSDGRLFASIRDAFLNRDLRMGHQTKLGPMSVVSFDQNSIPSLLTPLTAFRWFMEYGGRYGTGWENHATLVTPGGVPSLHPGLCVPHLHGALFMNVAEEDEMPGASSDVSRRVFELAPPPKQLMEIAGGHFGLLHHPGPLFERVSRAQREFLSKHLQQT